MHPTSDPDLDENYSQIFGALSEPLRIRMIRMIAETDELACTRLDETLPISKSTISYHVKVLYQAGLISVRKDGRYYHYSLKREVFQHYLPGFLDQLNGSERKALSASVASPRKFTRIA